MPKLISFISISLDGYFASENGDMRWAHSGAPDPEWNAFVAGNASGGGALVFGRVTYELMASYWPTPMAAANDPVVAKHMNGLSKIVFSKTLDKATWENTRLVKGDLAAEVRKLKSEPGPGMAILGSGSLVTQLASAGLIDEFQVVIIPIILGGGKSIFRGVREKLSIKLTKSRSFANGNVLLCYEPA